MQTKDTQSKRRFDDKVRSFQQVVLPIITIRYIKEPIEVNKRRLRLYLEIIEAGYPKCKHYDNETKAQFISNVFRCRCTVDQLTKLTTFKQITKKRVISIQNGNVKQIKRIRWRNKYQRLRNYIHSQ